MFWTVIRIKLFCVNAKPDVCVAPVGAKASRRRPLDVRIFSNLDDDGAVTEMLVDILSRVFLLSHCITPWHVGPSPFCVCDV